MTKTLPEIVEYTNGLDRESKALIKEILRISWQMRGGVNLNEAYMLTYEERQIINDIISENMELTKESQLPFI